MTTPNERSLEERYRQETGKEATGLDESGTFWYRADFVIWLKSRAIDTDNWKRALHTCEEEVKKWIGLHQSLTAHNAGVEAELAKVREALDKRAELIGDLSHELTQAKAEIERLKEIEKKWNCLDTFGEE